MNKQINKVHSSCFHHWLRHCCQYSRLDYPPGKCKKTNLPISSYWVKCWVSRVKTLTSGMALNEKETRTHLCTAFYYHELCVWQDSCNDRLYVQQLLISAYVASRRQKQDGSLPPWLEVLWAFWDGGHFLTDDTSALFTLIQLFLGGVKSCSDNPLSMTWKSIKGAVYKQLDEEAFYVESHWMGGWGQGEWGKRGVNFPF